MNTSSLEFYDCANRREISPGRYAVGETWRREPFRLYSRQLEAAPLAEVFIEDSDAVSVTVFNQTSGHRVKVTKRAGSSTLLRIVRRGQTLLVEAKCMCGAVSHTKLKSWTNRKNQQREECTFCHQNRLRNEDHSQMLSASAKRKTG